MCGKLVSLYHFLLILLSLLSQVFPFNLSIILVIDEKGRPFFYVGPPGNCEKIFSIKKIKKTVQIVHVHETYVEHSSNGLSTFYKLHIRQRICNMSSRICND